MPPVHWSCMFFPQNTRRKILPSSRYLTRGCTFKTTTKQSRMKPALSVSFSTSGLYIISSTGIPIFVLTRSRRFFFDEHTIGWHHFPQTAVWVYEQQMFIYNYSSIQWELNKQCLFIWCTQSLLVMYCSWSGHRKSKDIHTRYPGSTKCVPLSPTNSVNNK